MDWIEKNTTSLVKDCDPIAIEDLKVKNMVPSARGIVEKPGKNVAQKRGSNRAVSAQSRSFFRQRLQDKAVDARSLAVVVAVNPRFTSQACSQCEGIAAKKPQEPSGLCLCCLWL